MNIILCNKSIILDAMNIHIRQLSRIKIYHPIIFLIKFWEQSNLWDCSLYFKPLIFLTLQIEHYQLHYLFSYSGTNVTPQRRSASKDKILKMTTKAGEKNWITRFQNSIHCQLSLEKNHLIRHPIPNSHFSEFAWAKQWETQTIGI